MSGFDKDWLALREPVDLRARDASMVERFSRHLEEVLAPVIVDIGCGTGSTWRSLSDRVPRTAQWQLLDYDPLLLAEAERRADGAGDHPADGPVEVALGVGDDEGAQFRRGKQDPRAQA